MKTFVLIILITFNLYSLDTLRHFDEYQVNDMNVFLENDIQEYSERFEVPTDFHLERVRFKVKEDFYTSGKIKLYNSNGMDSKPSDNSIQIDERSFEVVPENNWIEVEISKSFFNEKQFFIGIELNENKLITTQQEYESICESDYDKFFYQQVKFNDKWFNSKGKFLIEAVGVSVSNKVNKTYSLIEFDDINYKLKNIIIDDLNSDSYYEIITNYGVYENNISSEFKFTNKYTDSLFNEYKILIKNDNNSVEFLNFSKDTATNVSYTVYDKDLEVLDTLKYYLDIDIDNIKSFKILDERTISVLLDNITNSYEYILKKIEDRFEIIEQNELPLTTNIFNISKENSLYHLASGELNYNIISSNEEIELEELNTVKSDMKILGVENGLEYIQNSIYSDTQEVESNLNIIQAEAEYNYKTKNRYSLIAIKTDIDNDGEFEIILTSLCDCRNTEILDLEDNELKDITNQVGMSAEKLGPNGLTFDINNDGKLDIISNSFGILKVYINEVENQNQSIVIRDKENKISSIKAFDGKNEINVNNINNNGFLINKSSEFHIASDSDTFEEMQIVTDNGVINLTDVENGAFYNDLSELLTENNSIQNSEFMVVNTFPNPFGNTLNFEIELKENIENQIVIKLFDSKGKEMTSNIINTSGIGSYNWTFKANNQIPPGMYVYEVTCGNLKSKCSIIKDR